jgi:hypothetical protein
MQYNSLLTSMVLPTSNVTSVTIANISIGVLSLPITGFVQTDTSAYHNARLYISFMPLLTSIVFPVLTDATDSSIWIHVSPATLLPLHASPHSYPVSNKIGYSIHQLHQCSCHDSLYRSLIRLDAIIHHIVVTSIDRSRCR